MTTSHTCASGPPPRRGARDDAGPFETDSGDRARRLCRGAAAGLFETDTGDIAGWTQAAELCEHCPVLAACRVELARVYPGWGPGRRRSNPAAVVWAGAIFSPERRLYTRPGLTRSTAARAARARRASMPTEGKPAPAPEMQVAR